MVRAWSFLTVHEADRQFGGNLGYEDVLGERYLWNNTVPNGRNVSVGDLVVLRDKGWVLGLAWVDTISEGPGKKLQLRCPECNSTGIKRRKTGDRWFRCSTGKGCVAEFPKPIIEKLDVQVFEADYARTWQPIDGSVPSTKLAAHYLHNSAQQSIRPLDLDGVRAELTPDAGLGPTWWKEDAGIRPTIQGGHKLILQKARIGQQQFRQAMLARHGSACAITGPQPAAALESAHLYRYAETAEHDLDGGLLLRRDLHTLFDRGLLVVDTTTWTIQVAPELHQFESLALLDKQPLHIPAVARPKAAYLNSHRAVAIEGW